MEMEEELLEMEVMPSASADENASVQASASASPVHADVTPQSEENDVQLPVLRNRSDPNIAQSNTVGRTEIPDSQAFSELSGVAEFIANLSPPGTSHVNHADPPDEATKISNEYPELQPLLDIASPTGAGQADFGTIVEQMENFFGAEPSSSMLSLAVAAVKGLQEPSTFVLNGEVRELGSTSDSRRGAKFSADEAPEQPEALPSNAAAIQTYEGLEVDVENTELENIPEFKSIDSEEPEKQEMKVDIVSVGLQKDLPVDLHIASNISDVASLDVERAAPEVKKSTEDGHMERELGKYTLKLEETVACFNDQQCDKTHQVAGSDEGNLGNLENNNAFTISIPEHLMDGTEDHTIIKDTHATASEQLSQRKMESTRSPAIGLENSQSRASETFTLCEKASVLEDGVTIKYSQEGDEEHSTDAINIYIDPAVETESSVLAEFILIDDNNNNALPSTSDAVVEEFSALSVLVQDRSSLPQGDLQMLDNDADPSEVSEESFIRAMATSSVEAPPSTHSPIQNEQSYAAMEAQPKDKEPVIKMTPNPLRTFDDVEKPLEAAEDEYTNTSVTVRKEDPETLAETRSGEDVLMPDAIADHPAAFKDDFYTTADAYAQEEINSLQPGVVEEKFVIPDSEDEPMPDRSAPNSESIETVNAIPATALHHAQILEEAAMHAQVNVLAVVDVLELSQSAYNDTPMREASIMQQKGEVAEFEACVNDTQETFLTASEEKEEARTSQKRVIQDSDDEDEASEELERSPMLSSAYHKSSVIASEPAGNLKAPAVEPVIVESKEAQFIGTPSSSPKVKVALPPSQKTRPKTPNKSFKLPTINKEKQSQTLGIQSSPVKSEVSNSSPSKPTQASEATERPQYEDPVMRELITMKIVSATCALKSLIVVISANNLTYSGINQSSKRCSYSRN
jgi:hypothetical protein